MIRASVLLALFCVLVYTGLLVAADKPTGSWQCSSSTPNGGEMSWTLTLKDQDGQITGTAGSEEGEISIEDARYENGTLTFTVSLESGKFEVTLKFTGDKVDGSWKGAGESGTVKGNRKA